MGLAAVYLGNQSWEDYISGRDSLVSFERALEQRAASFEESFAFPHVMQIGLSSADYQVALESGLGALGNGIGNATESGHSIEFAFAQLAGGLDQLNADFNFLLGDVIWKLEMH